MTDARPYPEYEERGEAQVLGFLLQACGVAPATSGAGSIHAASDRTDRFRLGRRSRPRMERTRLSESMTVSWIFYLYAWIPHVIYMAIACYSNAYYET